MTKEEKVQILLDALRSIANGQIELSYDKAMWQRDDYVRLARRALVRYHEGDPPPAPRGPINDDF